MLSDFIHQGLERSAKEPHYRQIYRMLQQAILSGHLPAGRRLPASRLLAQDLGLARNTITHAYEQLAAEGYVISTVGRGTYVANTMPDKLLGPEVHRTASELKANDDNRVLSERGSELLRMAGTPTQQWRAFHPGVPDISQFPIDVWVRLQTRHWRSASPSALRYGNPGGCKRLRRALAEYLRSARSVNCSPEQIIVTAGNHQSIQLIAQLLADHGDDAWIEDPCYWGARNLLRSSGLNVHSVAVGPEGMDPSPDQLCRPPRLIFISPSHQFPLGVVMSLQRRRMLLEYARLHGCWIVEDDYDSEFRYEGRPLACLQGLDTGRRVLYLGTFSKILYPGLRIGYLVVPEDLVDAFHSGLAELYREGQAISQAVLAEFIEEGYFTSHIRRMRMLYAERRALLMEQIRKEFGSALPVSGAEAGLHIVANLPPGIDDRSVREEAFGAGVFTRSLSDYYHASDACRTGLLLGYGCVPNHMIQREFQRLAGVILKQISGRTGTVLKAPPDSDRTAVS